jgi:putative peptide zinc metalloprotease protein
MNLPTALDPSKLVFKLRSDLQWSLYSEESPPTWVARDPLSLEYFYFSSFERNILCLLDGQRTVAQLLKSPAAQSITAAWLVAFLQKLETAQVIIRSSSGPAGLGLWQAKQRRVRRERYLWLLSPLAIRKKLMDPSRLLQWLAPLAGLLFSRALFFSWLLVLPLVIYFTSLELVRGDRSLIIQQTFQQLNSDQIFSLLVLFAFMKSLHELGHALACRKWNAQCHEIGILLLVFTPCLYCDTSDSWKLTSRWRRAAIAAAGIYVELLMATGAAILWLVTRTDSWLNWASAYVMAIGTISTVVVNANPLLRYDGYYILSDLWKVPNLSEQSSEALRAMIARMIGGVPIPKGKWDARPGLLAAYQIAATVYRTVLLAVILLVVWRLLDRFGLRIVGASIIGLTLCTVAAGSFRSLSSFVRELADSGSLRWMRIAGFLAFLIALGTLVFAIPLPTQVTARSVSRFARMSPIYARQLGQLVQHSPHLDWVEQGNEIARLRSVDIELELIEVEGVIALLEERLSQLRLALVDDEQSALELGDVIEQISMNRARREILISELDSLIIRAPISGVFVPSDSATLPTLAEPDHRATWRPLLSASHLDATIERGTLIGWIAVPGEFELAALVPEKEAERLAPDTPVVCRWDCHPGRAYRGKVRRIALEPVETTPKPLMGDSSFVSTTNASGQAAPEDRHYEVLIDLEEYPDCVTHQGLATVHLLTAPQTLGQRAYRFFQLNVRPELVRQN